MSGYIRQAIFSNVASMRSGLVQRVWDRVGPRGPFGAIILYAATWLLPALHADRGWVTETDHFRVLARDAGNLDAEAVATAATDLESIRQRLHQVGLGYPPRADGRIEVLLLPERADLHALLGDPPSSRTRGITVRGLDRDFIVVPWSGVPGPRVTLAHEYVHQLDTPGWPPWFSEGRAIYLARRTEPRSGRSTVDGLAALLDRSTWNGWAELVEVERGSPAAQAEFFQVKSWLLLHWVASQLRSPALLSPERAIRVLRRTGEGYLDRILLDHLAETRKKPVEWLVPLAATETAAETRAAAAWEIVLMEAELQLALQQTDLADPVLAGLLERHPDEPRVQAAYATMQLIQGRQDRATQHFGLALQLGDTRVRTAYRHAMLLMHPDSSQPDRAGRALRQALVARNRMPQVPEHHLAVVHARMLLQEWSAAFGDLQPLLRFPGWNERVDREAAEIRRRIDQSLRTARAPSIRSPVPELPVALPPPAGPAPWRDPAPQPVRAGGKHRWPPYGTWLVHGRIAAVRCSGDQQTVILHSPYQRIVLRVNPEEPPKLINRPFRGQSLPCGARGWVVAIAYLRLRGAGEVRGEIVGIRF